MSHAHTETSGIVLHGSRVYDVVFGRFIRSTDAEILLRAGVAPGDHLLDVGTGPGYLAFAASRLVAPRGAAIGIDASAEMIARARTLAARARSEAEYRVATAEALPFDDDAFDVVVSRLVFHHLAAHLLGAHPHTGAAPEKLVAGAGFTQLTSGRLMYGMLAGVAARSPERSPQG